MATAHDWVNIITWQRLAEILSEHVQQGTRLYVHGGLQTESWEDRNSRAKRYRTSVVAEKLIVLGEGREHSADCQESQRKPQNEEISNRSAARFDD